MSAFTETESEVYTSTNKYMAFALNTLDGEITKWSNQLHAAIAWEFDRLLPLELRSLGYQPAEAMMRSWINSFFSLQSRGGLIPIEANYSLRRVYEPEKRFSIDLGFQSDLDKGIVSAALRDVFSANLLPLSAHPEVTGKGRWRLTSANISDDPAYVDITFDIKLADDQDELDVHVEWVRSRWTSDSNWVVGPFYGIVEAKDTSTLKTLHVMDECLAWLPPDYALEDGRTLLDACRKWADAFKQTSHSANLRGHHAGSWTLFNFVHTGLKAGEPLPEPGQFDFETMFRFSLEGLPDSTVVRTQEYGVVAQAFEHLSRLSDDLVYAEFARMINVGLWNARHDYDTYLMPSDTTRFGPIQGDFCEDIKKYVAGTDALYWAFGLFETYRELTNDYPDLIPPPRAARRWVDTFIRPFDFDRFLNIRRLLDRWLLPIEIKDRRDLLVDLLTREFPHKYLAMALGLTIDWINCGWARVDERGRVRFPEWVHFINRVTYDGTTGSYDETTGCSREIYSDSKYNTLLMLVYAFTFTRDTFYLKIFDEAWSTFERLAADERLNGLFPDRIVAGALPDNVVRDPGQEVFLDCMVRAYLATVEAGHARPQYLMTATAFADTLLNARDGLQFRGVPFLKLAVARGTLRRVQFTLFQTVVELVIHPVDADHAAQSAIIARSNAGPFASAVVYMDPGLYSAVLDGVDAREFTVGARTVSVHVLPGSIEMGEEGFA